MVETRKQLKECIKQGTSANVDAEWAAIVVERDSHTTIAGRPERD